MPLPAIVLPSSTPRFLIAGHAAQYQSPFANVPMGTGSPRKRRLVTRRPHMQVASVIVERAEAADLAAWFRVALRSGERSFSAQVKNQGGGIVWYEAQMVRMYEAVPLHLGRWRVDMQIRLIGTASETPPELGSFAGDAGLELFGTAQGTVLKFFGGEAGLVLLQSVRFAGDAGLELE